MSKPFNEQQQQQQPAIRETLFGDMPSGEWPDDSSTQPSAEPWSSFAEAREQIRAGHEVESKRILRNVLAMKGLESRHYLQAWHFLRELGEQPATDEAKQLYGVVVEVALENGLDIVAAYADLSARYFNYSGAAVIWDRPDDSLDETTQALLEAGRTVVAQIGPWEGARPSAPPTGQARINMLTPAGLHFGQAQFEILSQDPLGGRVLAAATQLMMQLIKKTERAGS